MTLSLSDSNARPVHLSASERHRIQEEARWKAAYPYADEYAASMARKMAYEAEPRTLSALVNWARWRYAQEPPFRVHIRPIDAGGDPAFSPEFRDWIEGLSVEAYRRDHEEHCPGGRECDCYYRWPLRAALFDMHGRFEESAGARMADWCLFVASTGEPLDALAEKRGLPETWRWSIAGFTWDALHRLWVRYSPLPRS